MQGRGADCGCRAGKRDGDERSSPAERLRAYLENMHTFSRTEATHTHTHTLTMYSVFETEG